MSADEEGPVRKLREVREAVLPIIERFGGRVIDLAGDGILAEFPSAVRAVESAAAVQNCMAGLNTRSEPPMLFRIGVNVGDVIHKSERLYGDGINVAARLQAIAETGGICISNKVHEEVRDRVKLAFRDMGDQNLKNMPRPIRTLSADLTESGLTASAADRSKVSAPKGFLKDPLSRRLKLIGGVLVSIASAGAFFGGLAGYWNAWKAVNTKVLQEAPAAQKEPVGKVTIAPRLSVVVLPFANVSGDATQNYFADSITDD